MTLSRMPEPDRAVLDRSGAIIKDLETLIGLEGVISEEEGRRAFEADALTAYRQIPLAVVLPRTTEDVSRVLKYCHQNQLKVVPRGAGTSLCGGALPTADCIVIGTSRMNRVIEADFVNRTITVETGITNLAITDAVSAEGFFYAPDPSSQLACTVGGNLAMNSGGAHCLKYGVTTNNVLGLKIVLMDGEIVEIGGPYLDAEGYDFLALIVGSEGQFGIVTEATLKILPRAQAARPVLIGFNSCEAAGQCVAAIIGSGIIPVAIEYMDKPAIAVCEAYAKAGYPLDVEALLIVEVEGFEEEIAGLLARHRRNRPHLRSEGRRGEHLGRAQRAHLEGPQGRVRRHGPHLRLLLHGRHHPARAAARGAGPDRRRSAPRTASRWRTCSTPATATCIR